MPIPYFKPSTVNPTQRITLPAACNNVTVGSDFVERLLRVQDPEMLTEGHLLRSIGTFTTPRAVKHIEYEGVESERFGECFLFLHQCGYEAFIGTTAT